MSKLPSGNQLVNAARGAGEPAAFKVSIRAFKTHLLISEHEAGGSVCCAPLLHCSEQPERRTDDAPDAGDTDLRRRQRPRTSMTAEAHSPCRHHRKQQFDRLSLVHRATTAARIRRRCCRQTDQRVRPHARKKAGPGSESFHSVDICCLPSLI